jgi:uncharacterized protein (TIGR03067 family)
MQEDFVDKQLPARPNLDHLRRQAKTLLAQLEQGNATAAHAFAEHLPAARGMTPPALRTAKLKLADAQSVVARQSGFTSWPVLVRHVEQLRALEGEWRFDRLEVDGSVVPAAALAQSRILIDGDRFRTESPEGDYEGIFTIDTEASPPHFDIHFIAGPEAGNWSYGIYKLDGADQLTLCIGLVGSSRPRELTTRPGSGHALERLRRSSTARPANVTGGTPPDPEPAVDVPRAEPSAFAQPMTSLVDRLQGEWSAVELVAHGRSMPEPMLAAALRTMRGDEVKVVVGGQTIVHAKVRIDETATPLAVDYLSLSGKQKGTVTYGIMEWLDDGDVRFLMAPAGAPRPTDFTGTTHGTLSRWRRR